MIANLQICLIVLPQTALVFKREQGQTWQPWVIKGESEYHHHGKINMLDEILHEITERLHRKDKLASVQLSLVYANDCRILLENSIKLLHTQGCQYWQIICWDVLYQQAASLSNSPIDGKTPSVSWIQDYILPLLGQDSELKALKQQEHERALAALEAEKQQLAQHLKEQEGVAKQSHEQMLATLHAEKHKLLQELQNLKQQHAALARPNMEYLLSFLPAIFKDFWNKVRPDELSLIAGKIDTPDIPSPYFSPSTQAVLSKKRQFLQLAAVDQHQIKLFCQELSHNYALQIHTEFAYLLTE